MATYSILNWQTYYDDTPVNDNVRQFFVFFLKKAALTTLNSINAKICVSRTGVGQPWDNGTDLPSRTAVTGDITNVRTSE